MGESIALQATIRCMGRPRDGGWERFVLRTTPRLEGVVGESIALQATIRCMGMGRPRDGDWERFVLRLTALVPRASWARALHSR